MGGVRIDFPILLMVAVSISMLVSCSSKHEELLSLRHSHLQSIDRVDRDAGMSRGEQNYRMKGAVSVKEQEARLGHYYTVDWKNDQVGEADLTVLFEYNQAGTASQKLRMQKVVDGDLESGKLEFHVTGEPYRVNGQVLAWRVQLLRGDRVIAEKKSYMWGKK